MATAEPDNNFAVDDDYKKGSSTGPSDAALLMARA